ncbi:putative nuclear pore protein [Xylaria sp. CBS 124048]|nr:putative nuclear pore protein [Xylaria sp. CBS 124048]
MVFRSPTSEPENPHPFDIIQHGHKDLVQAIAFNAYGDRCATGGIDGRLRIFNRHQDGIWRLSDNWIAHSCEILELQWLPPTVYPNMVASLGIEGRFKLWAEDPGAPPGRRFSIRSGTGKPVSEIKSGMNPFRSFSVKHDDVTRRTWFALLARNGHLSVFEGEEPETLVEYAKVDDFEAFPKPGRGELSCFKIQFDPNPEPCYAVLRAGVPRNTLSLLASGTLSVKIFRTRETPGASFGSNSRAREFYLAVEIATHRRMVRDIAWAPANYRGYDIIATACQDGYLRVFRIDAPYSEEDGRTWAEEDIMNNGKTAEEVAAAELEAQARRPSLPLSGIRLELEKSNEPEPERIFTGQPGQIVHTAELLSQLDTECPVWRVGFDDDGQILGCVGDEGRVMCYRQKPNGEWAKSSELGMMLSTIQIPFE